MVAGWGSLATSCTSAPPPSLAALCTKPAAEVQYTQSSNTASPRTLSTSLRLVSVNNDPVVLPTPHLMMTLYPGWVWRARAAMCPLPLSAQYSVFCSGSRARCSG